MLAKHLRSWLLTIHLWLALIFGSVFVILGLSGSIIAWMPELDRLLNPALFAVSEQGEAAAITPLQVQAALHRLAADSQYGKPAQLMIPASHQEVFVAWYKSPVVVGKSGLAQPGSGSRQVMLDPNTLQIRGERQWGQLGMSTALLMPTIYHLHRYLLLGDVGKVIVAISGLMLVLMCLSGLLLWWPRPRWKAIWQAVSVNWRASSAAIHFRLHRMLGFFALPVLLLLGFSGSYFNQPQWLLPVMAGLTTMTPQAKIMNASPVSTTSASTFSAVTAGQALQIAQDLYPSARLSRLGLPSNASSAYEIRLRQPDEMHTGDGATRVSIDTGTGQVLRVTDPLQGTTGDRFLASLFPLHSGIAFGLAGRIFISCFGLLPLLLCVTGVKMWWKRRR